MTPSLQPEPRIRYHEALALAAEAADRTGLVHFVHYNAAGSCVVLDYRTVGTVAEVGPDRRRA